jgi:hypothetical protein
MSNALIAFFVSLVGSVIAGFIAGWYENKYKPVKLDHSNDGVLIYSSRLGVTFCSVTVFIAWAIITSLLIFIVGGELFSIEILSRNLFFILLALLFSFTLVFFGYGYLLRCDRCERHILLQESEHQKYAKPKWGLTGWALVVINVLFRKKFQCMSCGQRYTLK